VAQWPDHRAPAVRRLIDERHGSSVLGEGASAEGTAASKTRRHNTTACPLLNLYVPSILARNGQKGVCQPDTCFLYIEGSSPIAATCRPRRLRSNSRSRRSPTIAAAACAGVLTGPSVWSGSRSPHRVDPARSASAGRFAATQALTCALPHPRAPCSPPTYRRRHLGAIACSSSLRRRLPCQAEGPTGERSGHSRGRVGLEPVASDPEAMAAARPVVTLGLAALAAFRARRDGMR
jgi:hypothetical protein